MKIKDLADVCVDNAFLLFPLAEERYELLRAMSYRGEDVSSFPDVTPELDRRIEAYTLETYATLLRVSQCFLSLYVGDQPLNQIRRDRGMRVKALLSELLPGDGAVDLAALQEDSDIAGLLWSAVCTRLERRLSGVYTPSEDKGEPR